MYKYIYIYIYIYVYHCTNVIGVNHHCINNKNIQTNKCVSHQVIYKYINTKQQPKIRQSYMERPTKTYQEKRPNTKILYNKHGFDISNKPSAATTFYVWPAPFNTTRQRTDLQCILCSIFVLTCRRGLYMRECEEGSF